MLILSSKTLSMGTIKLNSINVLLYINAQLVGWFHSFGWTISILTVCDVWSFVSTFSETLGISTLVANWNRDTKLQE